MISGNTVVGFRWFVLLVVMISGCASVNPFNAADSKSAHLLGRRAILAPDSRLKEHVYFVQVNKKDLRDQWGDYPWDLRIPSGNATLIVVCEWYNIMVGSPLATTAKRVNQKFIVGHEYQFSSKLVGDGICELSMVDVTAAEYQAENKAKAEAIEVKKPAATKSLTKKKKTTRR